MTIIERSSNLVFASKLVGKLFAKQDADDDESAAADACEEASETSVAAPENADIHSQNFGNQASVHRLTNLIAAADAEGARIIGIVGAHRGVGASLTSRQLAGAYASYGRKTLLLAASDVPSAAEAPFTVSVSALLELAETIRPSLSFIDLGSAVGQGSLAPQEYVDALKSASQSGQTIIVDLPPIVCEDGQPNTAIRDLGAACDLVFLVCPTGEMRRKELKDCVETCRVVGVELNGLILNDWQLFGHRLLES